jgi:DNA replication protein DnaC
MEEVKKNIFEYYVKYYGVGANDKINNNMVYCKKCGSPKFAIKKNNFNDEYSFDLIECECVLNFKRQQIFMKEFESTFNVYNIPKRFKDYHLGNIKPDANLKDAFERIKNYVKTFQDRLDKGQGLYIFGGFGVGKTTISYAIAEELLNNGFSVLVISFLEIILKLKKSLDFANHFDEENFIECLSKIDLLIIDDLGVENVGSKMVAEKIFQIINRRYANMLPTIFNSNVAISELVGLGFDPRVVDRIKAMSTVILEIKGESLRK